MNNYECMFLIEYNDEGAAANDNSGRGKIMTKEIITCVVVRR